MPSPGECQPPPRQDSLEVIFYRDAKVDDGRYANNGWMQELPDPITKMTWDNAVLVSRKTARELGVQNGDVVEITLNGRSVTGPIWTQPGMADYSLGLALGYGRERAGRVGTGVGFNAYKIFTGKYIETGATIQKTGETYTAGLRRNITGPWKAGRRCARRTFEEFTKEPGFRAGEMHGEEPPVVAAAVSEPARRGEEDGAASMGHDDGFERVRRLRHLRGGLPEREQHSDCRQGPGAARPRNALDARLTVITPADPKRRTIRACSIRRPTEPDRREQQFAGVD